MASSLRVLVVNALAIEAARIGARSELELGGIFSGATNSTFSMAAGALADATPQKGNYDYFALWDYEEAGGRFFECIALIRDARPGVGRSPPQAGGAYAMRLEGGHPVNAYLPLSKIFPIDEAEEFSPVIAYKDDRPRHRPHAFAGWAYARRGNSFYVVFRDGDAAWISADMVYSSVSVQAARERVAFSMPTAEWKGVGSGPDIEMTMEEGFQYAHSTAKEHSDTIGADVALAVKAGASVVFTSLETTMTLTARYSHTWSHSVTETSSKSTSTGFKASCQSHNLPTGAQKWFAYQWSVGATGSDGRRIVVNTHNYLCVPQFLGREVTPPQCALGCCSNAACNECITTGTCSLKD